MEGVFRMARKGFVESDLLDLMFNPFSWDKKSYMFSREEKDMNPYSIKREENQVIIVHNVLGITKEDLKLSRKVENYDNFIVIEGETIDEITGKKYSISSRFMIDTNELDMARVKSTMKNGLLYITIPMLAKAKTKDAEESISID